MGMRTLTLVCLLGMCHVVPVNGQSYPINRSTAAPPQARFEILQADPRTFRLDRFAGRVDQLVTSKTGELIWREMDVPDRAVVSNPMSPRFHLFISASEARNRTTFLLNTETGQTWQLVWAKPNLFGSEQGPV